MEIKTTPPVKVMFFTTRTSLEELESFVVKVAEVYMLKSQSKS
ncbi:hypothetical protein BH10BAC2_BH10BAC2_29810 [soil metagenome]